MKHVNTRLEPSYKTVKGRAEVRGDPSESPSRIRKESARGISGASKPLEKNQDH